MSSIHPLLSYRKTPIRVLLSPESAWFAALDLYVAHRRAVDFYCLARISPDHMKLATLSCEGGTERVTTLSPLGVATVAKYLPPPMDRMLDGWIRREANQLAVAHGLPRLELSVLADGTLPTKPRVSHDLYGPWMDLQRDALRNPRAPNFDEPALFDNAFIAFRGSREAARASIAQNMAAGEAVLSRPLPLRNSAQ